MTKARALALAVTIPFSFGLLVASAQAQSVRTYVSSVGNDGNNCGRLTPCRTFQAAHDKTLAGGEITVLDQGNFAQLTITKSISIINEGIGQASILVGNGDTGLTVNAPNAKVNLRGLTIEGVGDSRGMLVSSVLSLTMANCIVRNMTGDGIDVAPPVNTSVTFTVSNTVVSDNGGNGIYIAPTGGGGKLVAVFNRMEMYNNSAHGLGLASNGTVYINGAVTESVSANNGMAGFVVSAPGGGLPSKLSIVRSVAFSNGTRGAQSDGAGATIVLSENLMQDNKLGTDFDSTNLGTVATYGDNMAHGFGNFSLSKR